MHKANEGLYLTNNVIRVLEEGPTGVFEPVKNATRYIGTIAGLAAYEGIPGVELVYRPQYPKNPTVSSVNTAGCTFNFLGTSEASGGYLMDVATDEGFTSLVPGFANVALPVGAGAQYHIITGLAVNTTYFVRCKSITNDTIPEPSIYCTIVSFRTKAVRSTLMAGFIPYAWFRMRETAPNASNVLTDASGNARDGVYSGTITYQQTALDQSDTANRAVFFDSTDYALLDAFTTQSVASGGILLMFDYKGSGTANGRMISAHNTANSNVQIFLAKPSSGNKIRVKINNGASTSLVDVNSISDFFTSARKQAVLIVFPASWILYIDGVLDSSGSFTAQTGTALDVNRVVIGGFGNSTIGNRCSGTYSEVLFKFGASLPTAQQIKDAYDSGVWV